MRSPSHQMRSSNRFQISSGSAFGLPKGSMIICSWLASSGVLRSSLATTSSSLPSALQSALSSDSSQFCRLAMYSMMLGTVLWYFIIFWWWLRHWSEDRVPTSLLTITFTLACRRTDESDSKRWRFFSRKDLYLRFSSNSQLPMLTTCRFRLILSSRFLLSSISCRWVIISYSLSLSEDESHAYEHADALLWAFLIFCITELILPGFLYQIILQTEKKGSSL